jgi:hypothetical protein
MYSGSPSEPIYQREGEAAAQALNVTLQFYEVRGPEELQGAFTAMTKARAEVLFVQPVNLFYLHARRIVDLAAQNRLPAMYHSREFVEARGTHGLWGEQS